MTDENPRRDSMNNLFKKQKETMLVNQILSGSIFMTAEEEYYPIKIKNMDILSSRDRLQNLIWNKNVTVSKLYIDETNCIVSDVYLNGQLLKELLEK